MSKKGYKSPPCVTIFVTVKTNKYVNKGKTKWHKNTQSKMKDKNSKNDHSTITRWWDV